MTSTIARTPTRLVFKRLDNKLSVSVNGVIKCSHAMKLQPNVKEFINAPLRFGGHQENSNKQNLNAELSKIVLLSGGWVFEWVVGGCLSGLSVGV